ncbi:MAG: hypothetical protein JNM99_08175 [Verrucomicrobiaceae bacterium]|nr:hypothetical protein [Verrucomicrobiaceae bacterium]
MENLTQSYQNAFEEARRVIANGGTLEEAVNRLVEFARSEGWTEEKTRACAVEAQKVLPFFISAHQPSGAVRNHYEKLVHELIKLCESNASELAMKEFAERQANEECWSELEKSGYFAAWEQVLVSVRRAVREKRVAALSLRPAKKAEFAFMSFLLTVPLLLLPLPPANIVLWGIAGWQLTLKWCRFVATRNAKEFEDLSDSDVSQRWDKLWLKF